MEILYNYFLTRPNYGTIERVTVKGEIEGSQQLGGIVARNGKALAALAADVPPAKILHCLNMADVTGSSIVGGIAGYFIGEMSFCGNEGTITGSVAGSSSSGLGGLVGLLQGGAKEQPFIISDCYNAGNVVSVSTNPGAGLIGNNLQVVFPWGYEYFNISDVFSYGEITATSGANGTIIGKTGYAASGYTQYEVRYQFANTYYREGIGTMLFDVPNPNGADGLGTEIVKEVIKSKTAEEFASPEMAALLNRGRTGEDAPWEYIAGDPYPTLRTTAAPDDIVRDPSGGGGGGCDAGAAGFALLALAVMFAARKRMR